MKVKPWQVTLVVAGLVVGTSSLAYSLLSRGEAELPHSMNVIDVETGELYTIDTTKYHVVVPVEHPKTKRICLVGVIKDGDGKWVVNRRSLETLSLLDPDVKNVAVNAETGEIQIPTKGPAKYSRTWKYE